jgi:hypothetical protein
MYKIISATIISQKTKKVFTTTLGLIITISLVGCAGFANKSLVMPTQDNIELSKKLINKKLINDDINLQCNSTHGDKYYIYKSSYGLISTFTGLPYIGSFSGSKQSITFGHFSCKVDTKIQVIKLFSIPFMPLQLLPCFGENRKIDNKDMYPVINHCYRQLPIKEKYVLIGNDDFFKYELMPILSSSSREDIKQSIVILREIDNQKLWLMALKQNKDDFLYQEYLKAPSGFPALIVEARNRYNRHEDAKSYLYVLKQKNKNNPSLLNPIEKYLAEQTHFSKSDEIVYHKKRKNRGGFASAWQNFVGGTGRVMESLITRDTVREVFGKIYQNELVVYNPSNRKYTTVNKKTKNELLNSVKPSSDGYSVNISVNGEFYTNSINTTDVIPNNLPHEYIPITASEREVGMNSLEKLALGGIATVKFAQRLCENGGCVDNTVSSYSTNDNYASNSSNKNTSKIETPKSKKGVKMIKKTTTPSGKLLYIFKCQNGKSGSIKHISGKGYYYSILLDGFIPNNYHNTPEQVASVMCD